MQCYKVKLSYIVLDSNFLKNAWTQKFTTENKYIIHITLF